MIEGGQVYERAWNDGVRRHCPEQPGHLMSWVSLSPWERASANAVYETVRSIVEAGGTEGLSRVQKGRFVTLLRIAQVHRHLSSPRESIVADWEELPAWQRETNADIFEHIEDLILGAR
ncbi:hypothetical protein [Actinokineospora terrae]|uniref:Uncharacterized protein n=1 Tax=Actinokineospora terrae TaxID=155974 RepID=A0A1H9UJG1_9PSEU|nr:hypothetical protein [Actinokineospora terrae]SES09173.1 hypothetical protein SAMN04487818_107260 [Actinokineospora terrae]